MLDALAAYQYLVVTLGFSPGNVIVCGESSGGHLAVALARYLAGSKVPSLPPFGALLLLAPTADWGNTQLGTPESTMFVNDSSDFVREVLLNGYSATSIRGALAAVELETNSWLSPASVKLPQSEGLFKGFPPTCIIAGGAEQTVDGMRVLRQRLERDNDKDKVLYLEYPDAIHDFILISVHEPERSEALGDIRKWLSSLYNVA